LQIASLYNNGGKNDDDGDGDDDDDKNGDKFGKHYKGDIMITILIHNNNDDVFAASSYPCASIPTTLQDVLAFTYRCPVAFPFLCLFLSNPGAKTFLEFITFGRRGTFILERKAKSLGRVFPLTIYCF
jgi:hypothetical protein